jgi:AraC family transcriptional regulator
MDGNVSAEEAHLDPGGLPTWKMQQITAMMQLNLAINLSGQRLAERCGLSVRQFSRDFRKATGLSPHKYLLRLRLVAARRLLMSSGRRLNEVALACGFADQSHFTRAFTAAERMPPGEWRRRNRPLAMNWSEQGGQRR